METIRRPYAQTHTGLHPGGLRIQKSIAAKEIDFHSLPDSNPLPMQRDTEIP